MIYKSLQMTILTLTLSACATPTPKPTPPELVQASQPNDANPAWRFCWFRTTWPEGEEPRWEVDLLLAHRLLGPVIAEQGNNIQSWRFHRRAVRDNAGHSFRFLFYTDSSRAADIINKIQQSPLRARLLESKVLQSAICQNPNNNSMPGISDTSDPNWSQTIQDNWPAYIMGVSRFWLGLINDAVAEAGADEADIKQLLQQYKQANETVTALWQTEGEHALLHHLSAIFGYRPMHIRF